MGIKDLPKGGINFRATAGAGNFQRKLSSATRYGGLKNLRDNQKAIVDTVKKYQGVIRTRGGLSRLQQRGAWLKIKASDKTVTKEDRREIKEVLKHLGRGDTGAKKVATGGKSYKTGVVEKYLTAGQIKSNINRARMQRMEEESEGMGRGATYSKQYAGGREVESYGVRGTMKNEHGSMEKLGVSWNKKGDKIGGFAKQNYENNSSNKPAPSRAPLTGTRPIGL